MKYFFSGVGISDYRIWQITKLLSVCLIRFIALMMMMKKMVQLSNYAVFRTAVVLMAGALLSYFCTAWGGFFNVLIGDEETVVIMIVMMAMMVMMLKLMVVMMTMI